MSRSKNSHPSIPTVLHGPKTQAAITEQIRHPDGADDSHPVGPREVPDAEIADVHDKELKGELHTGKHRLVEDRVQHDTANQKSEKTRLADDAKKHKHGNPHGKLNGGTDHH
ncbi:MAG: hypothetical protein JJD97_06295 [Gemmatimonadaceae bacterium]|nr:hypothetical protein [Gemmatimonadaceae bacterium]